MPPSAPSSVHSALINSYSRGIASFCSHFFFLNEQGRNLIMLMQPCLIYSVRLLDSFSGNLLNFRWHQMEIFLSTNCKAGQETQLPTESFDWFLSGIEWILNLDFHLLKLLTFYQKLLWNIRSRLNSSTFWIFRPVFRYVWSKLILTKHVLYRLKNSKSGRVKPRSDIP